ncbi:MAG: hypothetical protein RL070_1050 [Bacteroidota bacterium]
MVLCMQMLSNGIVLPYLDATTSMTKIVSTNQEEMPAESEDGEIEKSTSFDAIEIAKKDPVYPNTKGLQIIPQDNTSASLFQSELNTPPPKYA